MEITVHMDDFLKAQNSNDFFLVIISIARVQACGLGSLQDARGQGQSGCNSLERKNQ